MRKDKCIAIPTKEIYKIINNKFIELGYEVKKDIDIDKKWQQYEEYSYLLIDSYFRILYCSRGHIKLHKNNVEEISMYDLFQMKHIRENLEVILNVNGVERHAPLNIKTAKNLGLIK